MSRKLHVIAVAIAAAAVMGPIAQADTGSTARAKIDPQVPLKGSDSGNFTLTENGCGPGVFRVDIRGNGKAAPFGRYTYRATECFGGSAYSGAFTMTAANGDALVGIYDGTVGPTADPNVATYDQDADVTGGTGRFARATGAFHVSGLANLATGEYSQNLSGTVSRPKARDR